MIKSTEINHKLRNQKLNQLFSKEFVKRVFPSNQPDHHITNNRLVLLQTALFIEHVLEVESDVLSSLDIPIENPRHLLAEIIQLAPVDWILSFLETRVHF
jgi:hypothetical protein